MEVKEISRKPAVTATPSTSLEQVGSLIRDANVGSVVVVEHGAVVGIVTDRDIITRGIAEGLWPSARVESVMTREVAFTFEGDDLTSAATMMASRGCRRLPVLDAQGAVTGMSALDDLVGTFAEQIGKLAYAVQSEVQRNTRVAAR